MPEFLAGESDFKLMLTENNLPLLAFGLGGKMKKICPRCGVIFDAADATIKFCSTKCEKLFGESSLGYIKRAHQTERKVYAPEL